ncbi:MAG TPA: chemotaxis protein [Cyanobacteria bacterium UBA11162]|nr:chemotaxis protein [Cyanobacteria bacterium UBA11162]
MTSLITLDPLSLEPLPPETGERLLRFPLGSKDTALLPLEQIAEIIRVNGGEILPVPEMPTCVLGICNWRGEMLWLIDLNHLMGYPSLSLQGSFSPMAMVIQVNHQLQGMGSEEWGVESGVDDKLIPHNQQSLGLVVQHVNDIELHDLHQLQPAAPGLFPPRLLPFILGSLPGENSTVLDVNAIAQCPLWQIYRGGSSEKPSTTLPLTVTN